MGVVSGIKTRADAATYSTWSAYRAECVRNQIRVRRISDVVVNNHQRDAMEGRWKFLHTLKRVFGEGVQAPSQGGDVSGDPDESKRLQHADHGGYATQHWFL
jgi:hypothetical protein